MNAPLPNDLSAFWIPFTANRSFKADPRMLASAKDMHFQTPEGRRILDGTAGLWCVNAGHCRPRIVEAIQKQAAILDFAPTFNLAHPLAFELATRVADLMPEGLDHVFFTNSGSESVETALKIALAYQRARGKGHKTRLIGRERGYHGVNFGGISVGGLPKNRMYFNNQLAQVDHLPHTHDLARNAFSSGQPEHGAELADALERLVGLHDASTIAAVIVEPMAGSTGVLPPPKGYLERLRALCDKHDILLIFDEVITGFGRLGAPFAAERFGVTPDLICMAKGITNATVPMGAVGASSQIYQTILDGADAPIDTGDGAGMNLLNLNTLDWDPEIAEATAPGLLEKLPPVATKSRVAGGLAQYFSKFGLTPGISVAVWTGDNPASLVGSGSFRPGVAVISLGTSDTFFSALDPYRVDPEGFGHVFGHPAGGFMCLACFKNGSLARERVRTEVGVDWKFFDQEAFALTPAGNNGRWALPWFEPEITPLVVSPGLRANFDFDSAAPEVRIRAVVEAQALSLRAHSLWIGEFKTIRVTGGASNSAGILQTLADVFNATVETISTPDSAALGSAMIAAHAAGEIPYESLSASFCPASNHFLPNASAVKIYQECLLSFREFEREHKNGAVTEWHYEGKKGQAT